MEINLLPWREEIITINKKFFLRLIVIAVLAGGGVLVLAHQFFFAQTTYSQSYTRALERAKINLITNISSYFQHKKTYQEIAARVVVLRNLQVSRFETVRLLSELTKVIPAGIYLKKLSRKNNEVNVAGTANSNLLISQLIKTINHSPELEVTSLQKVEKTEANDSTITQFDLHFMLTMSPSGIAPSEKTKSTMTNPIETIQQHREQHNELIDAAVKSGTVNKSP